MSTDLEKNSEEGEEGDFVPRRHEAGFEAAAGPDESLLFVPQKYLLFGLSLYVMTFTIVVFSVGYYLYLAIPFFIMPIFCALLIFLPDVFAHHIHYRIQFTVWLFFGLFMLGHFFYMIIKGHSDDMDECVQFNKEEAKKKGENPPEDKLRAGCEEVYATIYTVLYCMEWLVQPATVLNAFMSYRFYAGAADA